MRGFDELEAKLNGLATALGGATEKKMVRAGAKVFRDEMVRRAPVLSKKTAGSNALAPGALKDDIGIRMKADALGMAEAHVGPGKKTAYVAGFVEYGHRLVKGGQSKVLVSGKTRGSGVQVGEVRAYPFARPAFEAAQREAETVMEQVLDAEVGHAE